MSERLLKIAQNFQKVQHCNSITKYHQNVKESKEINKKFFFEDHYLLLIENFEIIDQKRQKQVTLNDDKKILEFEEEKNFLFSFPLINNFSFVSPLFHSSTNTNRSTTTTHKKKSHHERDHLRHNNRSA